MMCQKGINLILDICLGIYYAIFIWFVVFAEYRSFFDVEYMVGRIVSACFFQIPKCIFLFTRNFSVQTWFW